ncbi:UNVERIFIED_CONTAM: hypothetical protein HDU68_010173 [Siphonaria sp. JEL0065]|nr:hypothetical protein HDU68_010173 [Siphonaria sp. JEL0065]
MLFAVAVSLLLHVQVKAQRSTTTVTTTTTTTRLLVVPTTATATTTTTTVPIVGVPVQTEPAIVAGSVPPAGYKFELGAWLIAGDTPGGFNKKLGFKLPTYQAAVNIPYNATGGPLGDTVLLDPLPGHDLTFLSNVAGWDDHTDASVFMTVYANEIAVNQTQGLDLVTDEAITHLAIRLASIPKETGRSVRMRWLPEMNGDWMLYGVQPARYVAVWRRMATIFRQHAPDVILVWAPNYDLPAGDDSYWPGTEYVDWVGTSVYWKGFGVNALVDKAYGAESIGSVYYNFAERYNKPFVIAEASGAWESGPGRSPYTGESFTSVTNQVDQATFQQSFWAGIIAEDIFAAFPLLRAAYIFEVAKQEEFFSDFRISNDSAVLTSFLSLVKTVDAAGWMKWANTSAFASSAGSSLGTQGSSAVSTNTGTTAKSGAPVAWCVGMIGILMMALSTSL